MALQAIPLRQRARLDYERTERRLADEIQRARLDQRDANRIALVSAILEARMVPPAIGQVKFLVEHVHEDLGGRPYLSIDLCTLTLEGEVEGVWGGGLMLAQRCGRCHRVMPLGPADDLVQLWVRLRAWAATLTSCSHCSAPMGAIPLD